MSQDGNTFSPVALSHLSCWEGKTPITWKLEVIVKGCRVRSSQVGFLEEGDMDAMS